MALHGQTVAHWPHDTHDDSLIGTSLSQITLGCSRSQSILIVSFTSISWHASTQRPHKIHWFGS